MTFNCQPPAMGCPLSGANAKARRRHPRQDGGARPFESVVSKSVVLKSVVNGRSPGRWAAHGSGNHGAGDVKGSFVNALV